MQGLDAGEKQDHIVLAAQQSVNGGANQVEVVGQRPLVDRDRRDQGTALTQPIQQRLIYRAILLHGDAQPLQAIGMRGVE